MKFNPGANLLLKGVVGSTAFGLANEQSDKDYLGIFVVPTTMLLGLESKVQESYSFKDPDTSYHEAGKYCRLALKCNPTVLDLLWLEHYNLRTALGAELVNLRYNFLSAAYVRNSYFGYAVTQLAKLGKDPRPEKRAKNARHFLRLLHQGWELYSTGDYSVRLQNPEYFVEFGQQVGANQDYGHAEKVLRLYEHRFNNTESVLPENANAEPVEAWLQKVRNELYQYKN